MSRTRRIRRSKKMGKAMLRQAEDLAFSATQAPSCESAQVFLTEAFSTAGRARCEGVTPEQEKATMNELVKRRNEVAKLCKRR